jgi:hypothetical protein
MGVFLLLALIWAVVLVPPALRSHAAQQEAFLASIGSVEERVRPSVVRSVRIRCRRRIAGGLLLAMAATLLVGLLPTFRVLLVVHLFVADSFIAYIALLAHWAARDGRAAAVSAAAAPEVASEPAPAEAPAHRRWRMRQRMPAPAVLPELAPLG